MLSRYVVGEITSRTDDVLLHANADVCLHAVDPSRLRMNICINKLSTSRWGTSIHLRPSLSVLGAHLPVTTSPRIPVLSP
jgi:hypothetical protein